MLSLSLSLLAFTFPVLTAASTAQQLLANAALADILTRGAPILGHDSGCSQSSKTCDWMRNYPDATKLVHMNLPGTHDSATWNYTQVTQDSLFRYTGTDVPPAAIFQCQDKSLFDMLNLGIRVFDLRFAYNPGNDTLGFHHSQALLAPTTTVEDVWFGLYSWLDQHPTEAVLISLNYESGTGTPRDLKLEQHIYDIMTSNLASKYWVQTNGSLGTLGEARGKLTFLQRYTYDILPASESKRFGIQLPPNAWTDNSPSIEIVYNTLTQQKAFIEDYYEIGLPVGAGAAENIQWKFNATTAHVENATMLNPDQLYISFASSEHDEDVPPETPRIMALGNGTATPGVNQKLLPWLQARKGKRFGIIMLDFFDAVPGLVEAVIGL
ncbi:PLC-like phosphodiesterase [Mycena albidolilacea]|uniref:PLC-like phosphodiesterase n=1 Tax=Mycena albidolilacea TaxID=1033008 RepID=A0AAD7EU84_9AGAR|nr:PLC-like phosphodiesterase [Mycena albidolilacea]